MKTTDYKLLFQSALSSYLSSSGFLGYVYPGQFYNYCASSDTYKKISSSNSYRFMVEIKAECKEKKVEFCALSPAESGEHSARETFIKVLNLARKWNKFKSSDTLTRYIAIGLDQDRSIAGHLQSRFFGGAANLTWFVKNVTLPIKEVPLLSRAHYKSLVKLMKENELTTLKSVNSYWQEKIDS
jgi:hypothetical protein